MTISRMQQPRQQYGLGSFVKKAVKGVTKGIKKIAKSPLGKAALLYAGGAGLGALGAGSAGTGFGLKMFGPKAFASNLGMSLGKLGLGSKFIGPSKPGLLGLTGSQAALGIGAASTLAGILASDAEMTEEEAEELKQDPAALRNYLRLYYSNLNPNASKEEVDSFVRTNMYADGGRVNYQQGSQPAPAPAQPGSLQGATSLYGDVVEYLKRQGRNSDGPEPRMISPDEIIGKGPATPYPFSGAGSFLGGGAINTPTPPTGGNNVGITNLPRNKEKEDRMLGLTTPAPTTPAPTVTTPTFTAPGKNLATTLRAYEEDPTSNIEKYYEYYTGKGDQMRDAGFALASERNEALFELGRKVREGEFDPYKYKEEDDRIKEYYAELNPLEYYNVTPDRMSYYDERNNRINYRAEGGRIGYAMGSPEQNAMQAAGIMDLPLNQNKAGVTELDLRKSGGFIPPVGVKEKADDIPAMLSNNEFVFTADAVRGMGNGNVNKGAQRMYDMMKKLEKGGRV
tara:strand:- start:798 stop:2327 length:1530 start_codon:yes stop_codon:yes gene_type:complete